MKILVTGAEGQLGYDVVRALNKTEHTVIGTTREQMDITDYEKVRNEFHSIIPDIVIHCAAYTAVDKAEDELQQCQAINVLGTGNIVRACKDVGAKLVYISTDYVFPGTGTIPYKINDPKGPLNVYGKTKLDGEILVQQVLKEFFIVRISWVFGINGANFVKTMLRLGKTHKEITVVGDQIGSPTYTVDVANTIIELIKTNKYGVYHATNEGYCSWAEFAKEIFKQAQLPVVVTAIPSSEYPTRAKRPLNSRLDKSSLVGAEVGLLPGWQDALQRFLNELNTINKS